MKRQPRAVHLTHPGPTLALLVSPTLLKLLTGAPVSPGTPTVTAPALGSHRLPQLEPETGPCQAQGLTAVGVGRPREVGEGAWLAGEGRVVVHEAGAARKAILGVSASNLQAWERGASGGAGSLPTAQPHPRPVLTRPACRPPSDMGPAKPEASAPWPGSSVCMSPAVPTAWLRSTWMASSRWSSILLCCRVGNGW